MTRGCLGAVVRVRGDRPRICVVDLLGSRPIGSGERPRWRGAAGIGGSRRYAGAVPAWQVPLADVVVPEEDVAAVANFALDSATGRYVASSINVFTFEGTTIKAITAFVMPEVVPRFGLPPALRA